jgi:hypothetical protein
MTGSNAEATREIGHYILLRLKSIKRNINQQESAAAMNANVVQERERGQR